MSKARTLVSSLAASAALIVALAVSEGFTGTATIPVAGDPPTVGFGSTIHEDGTPVRLGEKMDPIRALVTLKAHVDRDETAFQKSLEGAYLHQAEYDTYLDYTYQYGIGNWTRSSMRRLVLEGEYRAACDALLRYRYSAGYDCSTPENKRCTGVWTRQQARHAKCIAAQGGS